MPTTLCVKEPAPTPDISRHGVRKQPRASLPNLILVGVNHWDLQTSRLDKDYTGIVCRVAVFMFNLAQKH